MAASLLNSVCLSLTTSQVAAAFVGGVGLSEQCIDHPILSGLLFAVLSHGVGWGGPRRCSEKSGREGKVLTEIVNGTIQENYYIIPLNHQLCTHFAAEKRRGSSA